MSKLHCPKASWPHTTCTWKAKVRMVLRLTQLAETIRTPRANGRATDGQVDSPVPVLTAMASLSDCALLIQILRFQYFEVKRRMLS